MSISEVSRDEDEVEAAFCFIGSCCELLVDSPLGMGDKHRFVHVLLHRLFVGLSMFGPCSFRLEVHVEGGGLVPQESKVGMVSGDNVGS